jgi:putative glutamine amidotransferase
VIGITCEALPKRGEGGEYALYCDARYARAVRQAGGHPVLLPITDSRSELRRTLDELDGLVIVGGDDLDPRMYGEARSPRTRLVLSQRTAFEKALYGSGHGRRLPVFGICYGMQLVNVLEGGSLLQHIEGHRGRRPHRVTVAPRTALSKALGSRRIEVTTSHHQAVGRLGGGFRAAALADDGIIEAIENARRPEILAVQWHPERRPGSLHTRRLFRHFIRTCVAYRARRP